MSNIPLTKEEEQAYVDLVTMIEREISTVSIDDEYRQFQDIIREYAHPPCHNKKYFNKYTLANIRVAFCIGFPSVIIMMILAGKTTDKNWILLPYTIIHYKYGFLSKTR